MVDQNKWSGSMNKLNFQFYLLAVSVLTVISCRSGTSSDTTGHGQQPNILWIVAENMDLDLGCYGQDHVRTPHLDSLAQQGMRFTHVFSTSPVCAPSRSAFMTGMYQTSTDTHNMRSHREDDFHLPEGVRPITHRLQEYGYFTSNVIMIDQNRVGTGKLDLNFVNEGPIFQSDNWIELKDHQPFFAQINTPEAEYDIYDRKSAEKPRVKWVGEDDHPQIAKPDEVTPPPYYPDHKISRQEWARYLNSVSGMDQRVGMILDKLRVEGLADHTIIVFFADNGRLEARGIHWLWDTGIRVPMIIYWPEKLKPPEDYRPGTVSHELISLLDISATTLSMAGIVPPPLMQSRVFLGDLRGQTRQFVFSARDRIDETVIRMRSVRGKRYHYIRNFTPGAGFLSLNRYKEKCFLVKPLMRNLYGEGKLSGSALDLMQPFPDEQLYDTEGDPYEIQNIAGSLLPEHREALIRLRAALDTWMIETGDLGDQMEDPSIVAPFVSEMDEWFGTPEWYKEE